MFGSIGWRPAFTSIEIVTPGFCASTAGPSTRQALRISAAYSRVRTAPLAHDSCLRTPGGLSAVSWSQALASVALERQADGNVRSRRFSAVEVGSAVVPFRPESTRSMNTALSTLIASADQGDRAAADQLFSTLYDELHRMARRELSKRAAGMTLGATTLLHEAYLDISDREGVTFPDRNRFMGYAARAMRGLIIDYARRRQAQKRGGEFELTSLSTSIAEPSADADELTRLSSALDELEVTDPGLARVVDLKFFGGFSFAEIASMMAVSERTVQRDWQKARIYLHQVLRDDTSLA